MSMHRVAVLTVATLLALCSAAEGKGRHYNFHQEVPMYVNKIGPYANPSEVYKFYSFPFCKPLQLEEKRLNLGEVLSSNRLERAVYDIRFNVDNDWLPLCPKKTLTAADIKKFKKAIDKGYVYEMIYDDLPIYGHVGRKGFVVAPDASGNVKNTTHYYLYTHSGFQILYNEDQVIQIDLFPDEFNTLDITEEKETEVEFSYSVKWSSTDIPYAHRMHRYIKHTYDERDLEIQWFSVINSFVLVILLTGLLALILVRILRKDYARYMIAGPRDDDEEDESGWKLLHGDVFRFPSNVGLFSAMLGMGAQLFLIVLVILFFAVLGSFYPLSGHRGSVYSVIVALYAITAWFAGFVSGTMYKKLEGGNWAWNAVLTCVIFFGPLFLVFAFLNTVAIAYNSIAALPAGTIILIILLWALITAPLTVIGAISGKNTAGPFDAPTRTKGIPREIPAQPFYRHALVQVTISGFLPFSAIFIELHYIFDSVWGHKKYTLFGILFLTFCILVIVTSSLTVTQVYFQLSSEDHHWWWRSFFSGASTGFFIYAYCFYYFKTRSDMHGFMQIAWYFGYNAVVCYAFALLLGTVGFFSALTFVKHIYRTIHAD